MKLISQLGRTTQLEITLIVQSKNNRDEESPSDKPLITRYQSKIGNVSLIFNPTVAVKIHGMNGNNELDPWIPLNMFYRFSTSLSHVYQNLQAEKLYHQDGSSLYVDREVAIKAARRIPLFRNSLSLIPSLFTDRSGKQLKGVDFIVEGQTIGTASHNEVLEIIERLDHFDVTTFSLLAGVVDELESANGKLDTLLMKFSKLEKLLEQATIQQQQTKPISLDDTVSSWDWKPVEIPIY